MIANIIGVVDVRVTVSLPQTTDSSSWDPNTNQVPSTAVYIRYKPNSYLVTRRNQIKLLVSKAVPGLTPDNVAIYMEEAKVNSGN